MGLIGGFPPKAQLNDQSGFPLAAMTHSPLTGPGSGGGTLAQAERKANIRIVLSFISTFRPDSLDLPLRNVLL